MKTKRKFKRPSELIKFMKKKGVTELELKPAETFILDERIKRERDTGFFRVVERASPTIARLKENGDLTISRELYDQNGERL